MRSQLLCSIVTVLFGAVACGAAAASAHGEPPRNPRLMKIEPNRWSKLHEQSATDEVRFRRQGHGGSCFDTKRGHLVLFGSDTHGRDWENSPLVFEPVAERWTRYYPADARATYAVNDAGLPVAGVKGDHPWTMHTFGTLAYDAGRDEMVVACYPGHLVPGRFTNAMADLWPRVGRHPTWTFSFRDERWHALEAEAVHFFPHCATMDTDRGAVLGHRPDGIYELSGDPRRWRRLTTRVFLAGWHTNCAYDAKEKALIIFGHNENRNDVEAFWPGTGEHRLMPTPGPRPPKDQHNPMAFDPRLGQTVVIVDRVLDSNDRQQGTRAETWTYDLGADTWTQIPTATLPHGCGMNYNMEYDPQHQCLLLVTGGYGRPTAVWALRIKLP
jgi:hypothetical protein